MRKRKKTKKGHALTIQQSDALGGEIDVITNTADTATIDPVDVLQGMMHIDLLNDEAILQQPVPSEPSLTDLVNGFDDDSYFERTAQDLGLDVDFVKSVRQKHWRIGYRRAAIDKIREITDLQPICPMCGDKNLKNFVFVRRWNGQIYACHSSCVPAYAAAYSNAANSVDDKSPEYYAEHSIDRACRLKIVALPYQAAALAHQRDFDELSLYVSKMLSYCYCCDAAIYPYGKYDHVIIRPTTIVATTVDDIIFDYIIVYDLDCYLNQGASAKSFCGN